MKKPTKREKQELERHLKMQSEKILMKGIITPEDVKSVM